MRRPPPPASRPARGTRPAQRTPPRSAGPRTDSSLPVRLPAGLCRPQSCGYSAGVTLARDHVPRGAATMTAVTGFDTSRPNIARVYDYWLGGKDNFAADRELAQKMCEINP